jgi:8-oxo-dGTP pyrophosphatase MutT (NUDIX family)
MSDSPKAAPNDRVSAPLVNSAVLVPVYRGVHGKLRIVLIRRSEGGYHGGQLAFPGGKCDAADASLQDTALREAWEEIGLERGNVQVLADLPVAQTLTGSFRVFPFLARVIAPAPWRPDAREVSEVLEPDVADLARPDARDAEIMQFPDWPAPYLTPFYRVGPWKVWGVTYRILDALLPRLLAGEWPV